MGWFKKKKDPVSERARELKREIADLEGQIRKLSVQQSKMEAGLDRGKVADAPPPSPIVKERPAIPPAPSAPVPQERSPVTPESQSQPQPAPSPTPKLRSTARPHSPTVFLPKTEAPPPPRHPEPEEPIFEEVGQNPFRAPEPVARPQLDIRRRDLPSFWRRLKSNFRGPATSNPKLVSYLAAGSIQGLRPLRYERRVARNRFLVLVAVLIIVLWGIVALIFFR